MDVFYHKNNYLDLNQFGIQIPSQGPQFQRIAQILETDKKHSPSIHDLEHDLSVVIQPEDVLRVHQQSYVDLLYGNETQKSDLVKACYELIKQDGSYHRYKPESAQLSLETLVSRALSQTQGLMYSLKHAIDNSGSTYYLGGGFHHAMDFGGRGFCILNDIVVALRWAQTTLGIQTAWVIDVDAHKGDGTAQITQHDGTIISLSIHMGDGWPLDHGDPETDPWFVASNIDIPIYSGEESQYLGKLKEGLSQMLSKYKKPDVVLIVQGADPYEHDALDSASKLNLSLELMLQRDACLHEFIEQLSVPFCYCSSGGYGPQSANVYLNFFKQVKQT
ncbi:histone deacetylase [bacterium]|nr:histone deacetylase [bacterium]